MADSPPSSRRRALFGDLVEQHGAALTRLVSGYERDPAEREELMQEILLALWRSLESFRGDASLRTWMYRVAHNVAATHIHRAKRKPAIEPRMTESASTDGALDASLDDARRIDRLRDAIQTLGPLDRQLILLHLEKIPHSEIAQVTGLTATNVGTRIGRIRETLAQLMNTKRTP